MEKWRFSHVTPFITTRRLGGSTLENSRCRRSGSYHSSDSSFLMLNRGFREKGQDEMVILLNFCLGWNSGHGNCDGWLTCIDVIWLYIYIARERDNYWMYIICHVCSSRNAKLVNVCFLKVTPADTWRSFTMALCHKHGAWQLRVAIDFFLTVSNVSQLQYCDCSGCICFFWLLFLISNERYFSRCLNNKTHHNIYKQFPFEQPPSLPKNESQLKANYMFLQNRWHRYQNGRLVKGPYKPIP